MSESENTAAKVTAGLWTDEQVIQYLDGTVTTRTLYELRLNKQFPCTRIGGKVRYRQSDIDAWLDRQTKTIEPNTLRYDIAKRIEAEEAKAG